MCQITSKQTKGPYSVPLTEKEFKSGSLNQDIGTLKPGKTAKVVEAVCKIIRN